MAEKTLPAPRISRDYPELSLRDLYFVVFRHKRKICAFFFLVMSIVTLRALLTPNVYESEAKLMVRLGRESVTLDPTATTGQVVQIGQDRENEVNSEVAILRSRELVEKVVEAFGVDTILKGPSDVPAEGASIMGRIQYALRRLAALPANMLASLGSPTQQRASADRAKKRDAAVEAVLKGLDIQAEKKSNIISVTYQASSPKMAQDLVNKLSDFYLDKHIYAHRTTGSYQFFNDQKEHLETALRRTEKELRDLKNATGIAGLAEQRRILLDRTGNLQRELGSTEAQLAGTTANIQELRTKLANMPETLVTAETSGLPNSAADELRKRLNNLELKEHELLATFTQDSIPVQDLRKQISEARALLQKSDQPRQVTKGINAAYQEIRMLLVKEEASFSALEAKARALREQLAKADDALKTLNDTEVRLAQLQRDLEIEETNYRKYSGSLEQARIDHALEMEKISNISVVQPATYSVKPVRPRRLLSLAVGLVLGVFGSLGLAFFCEHLDRSFKRPEDVVEKLRLPVIASLPLMASTDGALSHDVGHLSRLAYSTGPPLNGAPDLVMPMPCGNPLESPHSSFLTGFGTARDAPQVIAVTSCHSGEGVSTVSTRLARLLAEQGDGRVLMLDANLNSPVQHANFGVNQSPGLADILSNGNGNVNFIQRTQKASMDLLAAGASTRCSGRSMDLDRLTRLLDVLKREYSHIIFDVPALEKGTLALQVAGAMEGVLLVVEAEATRWEVALRAKEQLLEANANLMGVILNKRRFYVPEWLYRKL